MEQNKYSLQMKGINKSFPGVRALKEVDFFVRSGEVHCLVGANGAGKSTLIKILAGAYRADSGTIKLFGQEQNISSPIIGKSLGIAVIYQELSLIEGLSVTENIFIGSYPGRLGLVGWKSMQDKAKSIFDQMGIEMPVGERVSRLSMGRKQIVEIAKALSLNARIIVMDEPSSTLSLEEFNTLVEIIKKLKEQNVTVVYISHKLEELAIIGDSVTVLRDGEMVYSGELAGKSTDFIIEKMIGHSIGEKKTKAGLVRNENELLRVDNISTGLLKSVSLTLARGEILGLYGLIGSGRTELFNVIYGVDTNYDGAIFVDGKEARVRSPRDALRYGIGLIPEDRKTRAIFLNLSVWENIIMPSYPSISNKGFLDYGEIYKLFKKQVDDLNIKTPSLSAFVRNLSGGNQQKVSVAKWLLKESRVLLFDEPTQGIDVGAKEEIYAIINKSVSIHNDKGVLVSSSEIEDLFSVCHRILVFYKGAIIKEFKPEDFYKEKVLHSAISGRG